jgi:hypothetical protein
MEANGGYGSNLPVQCEGDRLITDIMRGIDTALALNSVPLTILLSELDTASSVWRTGCPEQIRAWTT